MARNRLDTSSIDTFLVHGVDVDRRLVDFSYIDGGDDDLDKSLAMRTIKALRVLDSVNTDQPITILVNCGGGDVVQGLAVYDTIMQCKSPVHVEVVGSAYSMAVWVLQAGDVRRMHRHSSLMVHSGETMVSGSKKSMDNWARFYQELDAVCEDILLGRIREKKPRYTRAKLQKLLEADTLLWSPQALELGLIDEIVE